MEAEVALVINQYWVNEQFPHQILQGCNAHHHWL